MENNGFYKSFVLLAVLAHPDDESFGMGGTLAWYASLGVQVHLVCATRGEVGMIEPQFLEGFSSIADRRESELRCAAGMLSLAGVHFLDYRDSGMPGSPDNSHPQSLAAAPLEDVAAKVTSYIRRLRPQVVLTFDPIGGYKHPDHIAIHKATVRAFQLASDPTFQDGQSPYQPQKLYFHVIPWGMMRYALRLMPLIGRDPRKFGRNGDIDLLSLVEDSNFPIHAEINFKPVAALKDEAAACHASQLGGGPPRRGPLSWVFRWLGQKELFMRAFPQPRPGPREKDLFAGITSQPAPLPEAERLIS